eukprot:g11909.t1
MLKKIKKNCKILQRICKILQRMCKILQRICKILQRGSYQKPTCANLSVYAVITLTVTRSENDKSTNECKMRRIPRWFHS